MTNTNSSSYIYVWDAETATARHADSSAEQAVENYTTSSTSRTAIEAEWVGSTEPDTPQWEEQDMKEHKFKVPKELFKVRNRSYLSRIIDIINKSTTANKFKEYNNIAEVIDICIRDLLNINKRVNTIKMLGVVSSPRQFCKLTEQLAYAIDRTKSAEENFHYIEERLRETLDNISRYQPQGIDIINAIANLGEETEIIYQEGMVKFVYETDPIHLEYDDYQLELGEFEIKICYTETQEPFIEAHALNPNPSEDGNYEHPHTSDGLICLGKAKDKVEYMLNSGMITELIILIEILLKTYNPDSPYRTIEEWIKEYECIECGKNMRSDEYNKCIKCDRIICDDCKTEIYDVGASVCSCCAEELYCEMCKEHKMETIELSCCSMKTCLHCKLEETINCKTCRSLIHTDCAIHCEECDFLVCDDCITDYEDKKICVECIKKKEEEEEDVKEQEQE